MSAANNGGPAFARPSTTANTGSPGMSLRDYFAAKALQGLAAYPGRDGEVNEPSHFAEWAYMLADAMLAERAKGRTV